MACPNLLQPVAEVWNPQTLNAEATVIIDISSYVPAGTVAVLINFALGEEPYPNDAVVTEDLAGNQYASVRCSAHGVYTNAQVTAPVRDHPGN